MQGEMHMAIAAPGTVVLNPPDETTEPSAHHPPTVALADAIPRIYGYFYPRVGGNRALAEDLTQDTMLAAVRSGAAPRDAEDRIRWLFHIARNKLIDHYRRTARERDALGTRIDSDDPVEGPGLPDLDLESLPIREEVIATLAELNPRYRAAIVLKYFDGCDTTTVAEALFISESATTSLLARARNAYRSIWLQRNGDDR
jgi:RNA polymerase sigma-70 factor (ECF subfamily)